MMTIHKLARDSARYLAILALLFSFGMSSSYANEANWSLAVKGGPAFMMKSKSKAIPHLFKPMVRAELIRSLSSKTSFGLEAAVIASSNKSYRLIKVSALFMADIYQGPLYGLWIRGGFGLGNHPPIMVEDLLPTQAPLNIHVDLGLGMDWSLPFANSSIGLEIITDSLSVLSLVSSLRFKL